MSGLLFVEPCTSLHGIWVNKATGEDCARHERLSGETAAEKRTHERKA